MGSYGGDKAAVRVRREEIAVIVKTFMMMG
jgi:hypothetical protein